MDEKTLFEKDNSSVKNLRHLHRNVFVLCSPGKVNIDPTTYRKIDTEVAAFLPQNSKGFHISKVRGDKINELFHGKHRLWVEILNKSFEDLIEIRRNRPLGFLFIEPENLKFPMHRQKRHQRQRTRKSIHENEKGRQEAF